MLTNAQLAEWSTQSGVTVQSPVAADSCVDFGRFMQASPSFLLRPPTREKLASSMKVLAAAAVPYVFRGAAHSSGGQTLPKSGAIIDMTALDRVLHDDPDLEEITVEGGMTWLALLDYLAAQGRRPLCLTTSFAATVAGTIAVGGFGDTTHLHGMVTASVTAMSLVTPDGQEHSLRPGDALFDYSLAGRGQLGAVAAVTLRTLRRPIGLALRSITWPTLADLLRDSLVCAQLGQYEFYRSRIFFNQGHWLGQGIIGHFIDPRSSEMVRVDFDALRPNTYSEPGRVPLREYLDECLNQRIDYACPAVEVTLPIPAGVSIWPQLAESLIAGGILPYLQHGIAIMLVPRQSAPLAPLPDADYSFIVAIRPRVPLDDVARVVPYMRDLARRAISAGGSLYLMSVEPELDLIRRQFGDRWSTWLSLKRSVDPQGLCCPGLLL